MIKIHKCTYTCISDKANVHRDPFQCYILFLAYFIIPLSFMIYSLEYTSYDISVDLFVLIDNIRCIDPTVYRELIRIKGSILYTNVTYE